MFRKHGGHLVCFSSTPNTCRCRPSPHPCICIDPWQVIQCHHHQEQKKFRKRWCSIYMQLLIDRTEVVLASTIFRGFFLHWEASCSMAWTIEIAFGVWQDLSIDLGNKANKGRRSRCAPLPFLPTTPIDHQLDRTIISSCAGAWRNHGRRDGLSSPAPRLMHDGESLRIEARMCVHAAAAKGDGYTFLAPFSSRLPITAPIITSPINYAGGGAYGRPPPWARPCTCAAKATRWIFVE